MQSWAASLGITMSASYDDPAIAKKVSDDGNAIMRVRSEIHGGGWNGDIFTLPVVSVEEIEVSITEAKSYADNDMYRPYAIGEFLDLNPSSFGATTIEQVVDEETFMPKIELAARMGVVVHIHTLSQIETQAYLQAFEALDGDISDLRWQLAHLPSMTTESMDRLHALGGGGVTATFSYNSFESAPPPPFKELYEHEIHSGIGSDGGNVGTINPWLTVYHLATGLDDSGTVVFGKEETLTVDQTIELFTIENAWFSFDEDKLGSIEVDKLADLAVLSEAVFDLEENELEKLRDVKSVLTIMDGDIVYSDNSVLSCANSNAYGEWYPKSKQAICE